MTMIRHGIDRNRFRPEIGNDAAHIFPDFLGMSFKNQVLPGVNRENAVNVELRVGVGHDYSSPSKIMSVLRTLHIL